MRERSRRLARWVSVVALVAAGVLLLAVLYRHLFLAGGAGMAVTAAQGELQMRARLEPDPPRQKDQRLLVRVTRGAKPAEGGSLAVRYVMPAMGGMPEMSGQAAVEQTAPGTFTARFSLPMAGTWTLEVSFSSPGGSMTATYSMTVGRKGLTLVSTGGEAPGAEKGPPTVYVSPERRQLIGVKTAEVVRREAEHRIRTVATVAYDEARLTDISLQFRGWVGKLFVNAMGQRVTQGMELFTIYSPEVYAAEQDLVVALGGRRVLGKAGEAAVKAARRRLLLWQLSPRFVQQLEKTQQLQEYVPVSATASGYVIEKNVFEGTGVKPGQTLYRLAGLRDVWFTAQLYEADLELVRVGQTVAVTLPYQPGARYEATIDYVYPYLQSPTRTGPVRIVLSNPALALKPAMYADIELAVPRGERLLVPMSAVIYVGPRRVVFVDLGNGRLELRDVQVGLRDGDEYEVISGLTEGEKVVVSGTFLISSESRIKAVADTW